MLLSGPSWHIGSLARINLELHYVELCLLLPKSSWGERENKMYCLSTHF